MMIIIKENNYELNAVNMHDILSDFNQGHNSGPSMADRVAKFLLSKENMNNSIIYTYIDSAHDITKTKVEDIPQHDVLCAGFPCQPFSKTEDQMGFEDKTKGTLFFEICRILKYHHTPLLIELLAEKNTRNLHLKELLGFQFGHLNLGKSTIIVTKTMNGRKISLQILFFLL